MTLPATTGQASEWLERLAAPSVTFDQIAAMLRPALPLLEQLPHTPQEREWHAEGDVAAHSHLVVERAHELAADLSTEARAALLLSAALHDIGKALTTRKEVDAAGITRLRSRQHARRGRDYLAYRLLETPLPPPFILTVLHLVAHHHSLHRAAESNLERGIWRLARQLPLPLLVPLAKADARGRIVLSADGARGEDTAEYFELLARDLGLWQPYTLSHWPNADPYADFRAEVARLLVGASPTLRSFAIEQGIHDWEAGLIHTPHEAVARVQQAARGGFPRLSVLCGPSGSGKSTLAEALAKGGDGTGQAEIINLDAWRAELGSGASDQRVNGQVMQAAREQLREVLRRGGHAIWDATSLRASQRRQVLGLGHDYGAYTELHVLWTAPSRLAAQNAARSRQVSGAVMADQLRLLEFPEVGEAHTVKWHTDGQPLVSL